MARRHVSTRILPASPGNLTLRDALASHSVACQVAIIDVKQHISSISEFCHMKWTFDIAPALLPEAQSASRRAVHSPD